MLELDKYKSLADLATPPAGFFFEDGVGCTYSANEEGLALLKNALCVTYNHTRNIEFEERKTFRLYVQQGQYKGKAKNYITAINNKDGNLHAKVYFLKYSSNDGETRYRVIVTSANLTDSDELNVYAVFDSECEKDNDNDFTKKIIDFFCGLPNCPEFVKEYEQAFFNTSAAFIKVDKKTLKAMEEEADNAERVLVVSPFLTKDTVKILCFQSKSHLISCGDQFELIGSKDLEGINLYTFNSEWDPADSMSEEQDSEPEEPVPESDPSISCSPVKSNNDGTTKPSALHAKLYVFEKPGEQIVYIGSANATDSAFGKNIEALIRVELTDKIDIDSLLKDFNLYCCKNCDGDEKRQKKKEFEVACREIVRNFSYDNNSYKARNKDGFTLSLKIDGQEENKCDKECLWQRKKQERHIVELTISNGEYGETFPLFIDGNNLCIDEERLYSESTEMIYRELTSKDYRNVNKENAASKASLDGSFASNSKIETITGYLYSIKPKDQPRKICEIIKNLLEKIDDENDKRYKVLSSAKKALEKVWPKEENTNGEQ